MTEKKFRGSGEPNSDISLSKKYPKSGGFPATSRPPRGDRAPIGPMYPLDLYTTLKSKPRNTSRREGLAEFGPSATVIREVKFEISTKISEVDFMTFF